MRTEHSESKDNWKRITCILFALLLICNAVLFILSLEVKNQLREHNEILLAFPPDLQKQIFDSFQRNVSDIETEILKDADAIAETITVEIDRKNSAAIDQMLKSVERQMLEQENNTSVQLAIIKEKVDAIETNSSAIVATLEDLQIERAKKTALYLNAARASLENPETAQILYVSALTYSEDKAGILEEFIDWQISLIKQDLDCANIELAQERLIALAGICDANIALGSVRDMESIPALKNKLMTAEQLIEDNQNQLIATQQEQINSFIQRLNDVTSYSEAEELLNELTAFTVAPALNEQKDDIVAKIILKQSYLTAPTEQLIIPAISDDTPWNEWLKNFTVRLKSDLPILKKLEDLGTAAEFLEAAKTANVEGVQDLIAEIEKASRDIYLSYWKERVVQNISSPNPDLNEVSTLIAESNAFNAEEQEEYQEQIIQLNKYIIRVTLSELTEELTHLKSLEDSTSDEIYMQMIGATQGQHIQLLLKLKALDAEFENQFTTEISDVTQKISSLDQLMNSYKNRLIANDLNKNEAQRVRFVEWAKQQIQTAKDFDDAGEKIADTWESTRSSDEAVNQYTAAWRTLMVIHPSDLQNAHPALFETYRDLKTKIENHCPPPDDQRKLVKYKRIYDF